MASSSFFGTEELLLVQTWKEEITVAVNQRINSYRFLLVSTIAEPRYRIPCSARVAPTGWGISDRQTALCCCGSLAASPAPNCISPSQSLPRTSQILRINLQHDLSKLRIVDCSLPTRKPKSVSFYPEPLHWCWELKSVEWGCSCLADPVYYFRGAIYT